MRETRTTTALLAMTMASLLALPALQAQQPGLAKRALNQALEPSEAELTKRVTPVVRAVRSTADSVFSVILTVPGRRSPLGQGSGVIIDENGLAITNWHVVALASDRRVRVQVKLRNNDVFTAKVLSTSKDHDLALLQLDTKGSKVQPITMGDSDSLMIGETVIAIGNPKGHQNTVTVGVLSARQRAINVRTPDGQIRKYEDLLQTDAAINQGNSGGALLDITGKLIGINNAVSVDSENIGFAIPVNTVRTVFHEILLSSENISTVYLGMRIRAKDDRVELSQVTPSGPAARSGFRQGDELLSINGTRIQSPLEYARTLLDVDPEKPLRITVRRNGREITRRTIPMSNAAWTVARRIGLEFKVVTVNDDRRLVENASAMVYRELRSRVRVRDAFLVVTYVRPGLPGANLGIQKGDVLLGIVDRVPEMFRPRQVLKMFNSVSELNDALHVMANRYRDAEYNVWLLRDGGIQEGPLDVPRL